MSGSFFRKSSISRLLRSYTITGTRLDPSTTTAAIHSIMKHQTTQTKAYFRFPQIFRKSREFNEFSPPFFTSPFSSSSSTPSSSTVPATFVGWYLAMVKSRPILTKSVTSSLIYVAADLSSQVIWQMDVTKRNTWFFVLLWFQIFFSDMGLIYLFIYFSFFEFLK